MGLARGLGGRKPLEGACVVGSSVLEHDLDPKCRYNNKFKKTSDRGKKKVISQLRFVVGSWEFDLHLGSDVTGLVNLEVQGISGGVISDLVDVQAAGIKNLEGN